VGFFVLPGAISRLEYFETSESSGELLRKPIVQAIAPYSVGVNDEIPRNAL
jgi:hypothetical protein